jgi:predicted  nucleic acid-binding Zn-ribbon protein
LVRISALEPFEALQPFAEKKKPTDADVTEALMVVYPDVTKMDAASWEKSGVSVSDTQGLLKLVRLKKGALRAHGLSAWGFEKKLEKLVAAYPSEAEASTSVPVVSTPTVVPNVANSAELKALREQVAVLEKTLEKTRAQTDATKVELEKTQAQAEKAQAQAEKNQAQAERIQSEMAIRGQAAVDAEKARTADRESQREEARLLKGLVEDLQAGQKRLESAIAAVDKKAEEKSANDEEMSQSLSIMRKDLRDNVQDVSVLKQKVEKLMAPEKAYARPLDKVLASKWIPGAALLIAVGAIVISASKK